MNKCITINKIIINKIIRVKSEHLRDIVNDRDA